MTQLTTTKGDNGHTYCTANHSGTTAQVAITATSVYVLTGNGQGAGRRFFSLAAARAHYRSEAMRAIIDAVAAELAT